MTYDNCSEAYAAHVSDIPRSSPDYAKKLDRDNDGIGCETADAPADFVAKPERETRTSTQVETGNGNGDALPKTGPESVFALAGVLLLLGVALAIVMRRRKTRFVA